MSKRKKELNYRTMWIHNPLALEDEGMDPHSFAKYSEAPMNESELNKLMPLKLLECNKLEDSYIELKYKVL